MCGSVWLCETQFTTKSQSSLLRVPLHLSTAFEPAIQIGLGDTPTFTFIEGGCSRCATVYIDQLNVAGDWVNIDATGGASSPFLCHREHWCNEWDGTSALRGRAQLADSNEIVGYYDYLPVGKNSGTCPVSVYLCVCVCICLSLSLSVSLCPSMSLSVCPFLFLSACQGRTNCVRFGSCRSSNTI